mmetsp:Transcript_12940/g.48377  ORF Transcript_12940/g.48377 Transcript_12940/m.48377 type:complete len:207 (-) Transcript_12940:10313-10933(-)
MIRILSPNFCLIHLMPCSCGSIISAHRAADVMIAPFSMESGSVGKPSIPHPARMPGVDSTSSGVTPVVIGISRSIISGSHFSLTKNSRNLVLNGPAYDTNEEPTSTSPTSLASATPNAVMASPQRLFSPDKPFTSRSAKFALACVFSAAAMALFLSSVAAIKSDSRFATRSCKAATFARIPESFVFAASNLAFASASIALFGATTW